MFIYTIDLSSISISTSAQIPRRPRKTNRSAHFTPLANALTVKTLTWSQRKNRLFPTTKLLINSQSAKQLAHFFAPVQRISAAFTTRHTRPTRFAKNKPDENSDAHRTRQTCPTRPTRPTHQTGQNNPPTSTFGKNLQKYQC